MSDVDKKIDDQIQRAFRKFSSKDDTELIEKLEGVNIEDIDEIMEQLNELPAYYARAAYLYNEAKKDKEHLDIKKDKLYSVLWAWTEEYLFDANREAGKTANNSTPTNKAIESFIYSKILSRKKCKLFSETYQQVANDYKKIEKKLVKIQDRATTLRIVRDSWDKKEGALKTLVSLITNMMNHKLYVFKDKEGFRRK